MKKLLCIILIFVVLAGLFTGCSSGKFGDTTQKGDDSTSAKSDQEDDTLGKPGELPVVLKPYKLSILTHQGYAFNVPPSNDLPIYKRVQELTGVEIEWQSVPGSNLAEVVKTRLAAAVDLPDMINMVSISANDVFKFGQNKLFLELSKLIDKNTYYLKKLFDENKVAKASYMDEYGNIYSVPESIVMETEWQYGTLINSKWLEKLGLSIPNTVDEFYNVLQKFKKDDPNGNLKDDEIPLAADQFIDIMGAAWGLNTEFNGVRRVRVDAQGKVQMDYINPRLKEFWAYLNRLYKEGLLDRDFTANTLNTFAEKIGQDRVGAINWYIGLGISWNKLYDDTGNTVVFHPIAPLIGPYGDQNHYKRPNTISHWVITKECKNPEIALRYYDAVLFHPELINLLLWGIEDETYEVKDGVKQFINQDRDKLVQMGGLEWCLPNHQSAEYGIDIINRMLTEYDKKYNRPYFTLEPFPEVSMTKEESEDYKKYITEINTYYDEMRVKFISGQEPLDNFDKYVNRMKEELGIEKIQIINQQRYDRFKKFINE